MIKTFADRQTQELFVTGRSKRLPPEIVGRARRKLEYVDLAVRLDDLRVPRGNRLHKLTGTARGSTPSPSTTNGESAFGSPGVMRTMSKSQTITEASTA